MNVLLSAELDRAAAERLTNETKRYVDEMKQSSNEMDKMTNFSMQRRKEDVRYWQVRARNLSKLLSVNTTEMIRVIVIYFIYLQRDLKFEITYIHSVYYIVKNQTKYFKSFKERSQHEVRADSLVHSRTPVYRP